MNHPVKILLVENNQTEALYTKEALLKTGYSLVATVPTAHEAISTASELKPDLILMDILLQGDMDGITAAAVISEKHDIPIVFLTAHSDDAFLERVKVPGTFGYLVKPASPANLRAAIEIGLYTHASNRTLKQINTQRLQTESQLRKQRDFRERLLQTIPIPVFVKDLQGTYIDCNTAFELFSGFSREEFIGKTIHDFVSSDDAQQHADKDTLLLTNGGVQVYPATLQSKTDQFQEVIFYKVRYFDQDNSVTGIVGAIVDITELNKARRAVEAREAEMRSISKAAPVGIGSVTNRIITFVNDRMCDIIGYSADELIGQSSRILYQSQEEYERVGTVKYAEITKQGSGSIETQFQHKNGRIIDILLSSTPVDTTNLSRGVTFTALDITTRKKVERERRDFQKQLRQAQKMEAIGTLAGGIAHDFNNILFALAGYATLAKQVIDPSNPAYEYLGEIEKSINRASDLVKHILTFSRQDENEYPRKPLLLHHVVNETLSMLSSILPESIAIQHSLADSCPPLLADPTQVHQVLMNLCMNAYQAMQPNGGVLDVTLLPLSVSTDSPLFSIGLKSGEYVLLRVSDTGTGIDETKIERIFEPYFTTKGIGEGTGFGLATVHGIVSSYGGKVLVESAPGDGSVFSVYFPVCPPTPS